MPRRLPPPATGLGAAFLAMWVNMVLTACTTPCPRLDAEPAPIAWQATDRLYDLPPRLRRATGLRAYGHSLEAPAVR